MIVQAGIGEVIYPGDALPRRADMDIAQTILDEGGVVRLAMSCDEIQPP
jgi:deoxycytidylate deaminase